LECEGRTAREAGCCHREADTSRPQTPAVRASLLKGVWRPRRSRREGVRTRKCSPERLRGDRLGLSAALAGLDFSLNNKNRAFEDLERAFQAHNPGMVYLLINRRFLWKDVGDDPRYLDLLKRMGFPRLET
jgi:hypothetical protein